MELFSNKGSIAVHPKLEGQEAFYYEIGPALAEKLLTTYSVDYRKLLPNHMRSLARDMEQLNWIDNGDTLKISKKGDVLDGQHRLHAVATSKVSQVFLIVTGISEAAYDITDAGRQRRYKDTLRRLDYGNVDVLASVVRMVYMWENDLSLADTCVVTYPELNDVLLRNNNLIKRAMDLGVGARNLKMAPSLTIFCWWVFMQIDEEKAHMFMSQAIGGEMIKRGDPAFTFRNRLQREYEDNAKYSRNQYFRMAVDSWNKFYDDLRFTQITISSNTNTVKKTDIMGWKEPDSVGNAEA